ncbi:hypothetical protein V8C86DRAFT_1349631 [Haematococcus lacustris]
MGNSVARAAGSGVRRQLPKAVPQGDAALLEKIASQEQARLQELPSYEELNAKNVPLDDLLSKIYGGVRGQQVDITGSSQPQGSAAGTAQQGEVDPGMHRESVKQPHPADVPSTASHSHMQLMQAPGCVVPASDTEPGRVQAYILREILEAKNAMHQQGSAASAEAEEKLAPDQALAQEAGVDLARLQLLHRYCAVPLVAKVKTFGHEFALARPPRWWHSTRKPSQSVAEAAVQAAFQQRQQELNQAPSPSSPDSPSNPKSLQPGVPGSPSSPRKHSTRSRWRSRPRGSRSGSRRQFLDMSVQQGHTRREEARPEIRVSAPSLQARRHSGAQQRCDAGCDVPGSVHTAFVGRRLGCSCL